MPVSTTWVSARPAGRKGPPVTPGRGPRPIAPAVVVRRLRSAVRHIDRARDVIWRPDETHHRDLSAALEGLDVLRAELVERIGRLTAEAGR
jgi:hypothetical protein